MSICLPDVNVRIALHDSAHPGHGKAHQWFTQGGSKRWATCPLTENGFVRVLSQPRYPNNVGSPAIALAILQDLVTKHISGHQFWHDSPSLRDKSMFRATSLIGPNQITHVYLLGLLPTKRWDAYNSRHGYYSGINRRAALRSF